MEPNILTALIGALGAIAAAIIGAAVGRSENWDRLFARDRFPKLSGTRWESSWLDLADGKMIPKVEVFTFTKQRRGRVYGYITMAQLPELKWEIEGDYNNRFLRLFWQPAADAQNKFFLDYGCYFFERQGLGSFHGYAVGFDLETNKIEIAEHQLRRLPG